MENVISKIGSGSFTTSAYDMAWIARLGADFSKSALEWVRENQLSDGSWGTGEIVYYHDRLVCTLSAVVSLAEIGEEEDKARIYRGLTALGSMRNKLHLDPAGETVGFEMIVPSLLLDAQRLGLIDQLDVSEALLIRQTKLSKAPGNLVNRHTTLAHSAEMVGSDNLHLLDAGDLQEENGSVGHSPAATAFFIQNVDKESKAMEYLRFISDIGAPFAYPTNIFEIAWILWNLDLANCLNRKERAMCEPWLDVLEAEWMPGEGIGYASGYTPRDGDDTALVYEVLGRFGRSVDLDAVLSFEEDNHFRTYDIEANTSVSTNIHFLSALRYAGFDVEHPSIVKILTYLKRNQRKERYWLDKWHTSPFYTTCHLVTAVVGYHDALIEDTVDWLLEAQKSDGSWGHNLSTAEETAYCLQALVLLRQVGYEVPLFVLERGYEWLKAHEHGPYPPLWIGKCLYTPVLVVESAIVSALHMARREIRFSTDNHAQQMEIVYKAVRSVRFLIPEFEREGAGGSFD